MYIWILLATIMVAMTFFNVSPRVDKEHALNEIRAATVTNRFKAEHEAMLKTMECEIMYGQNNGWDSIKSGDSNCPTNKERASACGPVDVSCYNPLAAKKRADCSGVSRTINDEKVYVFSVPTGSKIWSDYPSKNNFMTHIPMGYDINNAVFPKGMYHFVYCLTEYAEDAKNDDNYIRCDLKHTTTDVINTEDPENQTTTTETKKSNVGGYGRYLVSFAQIPEKWLSKKTDEGTEYRYPLPVFTNMLAKDTGAETIYGWTKCSKAGSCQLFGLNAQSGHLKRADEGRRYETDKSGNVDFDIEYGDDGITIKRKAPKIKDNKGVSVDIISYGKTITKDTETGEETTKKKRNITQVFEYELLKSDALFWKNKAFQAVCTNTPCVFAYEVFPSTDTAYHCYNLMHEEKRTNNRKRNKTVTEPTEPVEPTL